MPSLRELVAFVSLITSQLNLKKIMVIDFDVHHGDGTQEIFYSDDSVIFCSVHRKSIFPKHLSKGHMSIGEGKGKGYNVNINLEQGLKNGDLLAVFDYVFVPLAEEFNPDIVLISAGFDAAIDDPLGVSYVTPRCFGELICRAKTISHGKLVLALEGGYCTESLAESCAECVNELLDEGSTQIAKCKYEDADSSMWKVIAEVCSVLGEYWPCLKGVAPHEDEPSDP
ncbi:histone deacetylase 5-like [Miscanthus floridulus]|uniref:histone deacetylase 5-like n=1 Tax=Miscanthus floridulus TaxID=154761 RepID=UPI003459F1FE